MKDWITAILLAAMLSGLATVLALQAGSIDSLRAEVAAGARHQRAANEQVAALRTELDSKSLTGDLLTCTDLRNFEQAEPVSSGGTDSLGGSITVWSALGNWLPSHCYKP
jgi:hypothetical protein